MNILVTGANGFIGKNSVRFLRQNTSYTVYEFSRENLLEELDELIYRINIVNVDACGFIVSYIFCKIGLYF